MLVLVAGLWFAERLFCLAMRKGVCKTVVAGRSPRKICFWENDGKGRYFAGDQCRGESNGRKSNQHIQQEWLLGIAFVGFGTLTVLLASGFGFLDF